MRDWQLPCMRCGDWSCDGNDCESIEPIQLEIPMTNPADFTFLELQAAQAKWAQDNFGSPASRSPHQPLLGALEELGELAHAHLKSEQGIRGDVMKHHLAKIDAVADVIIYLADYCTLNGIDLALAVVKTWRQVESRDWKANPEDGQA